MRAKEIFIAKPYKRNKSTVKSPLRYPGGKFYALKHIMPFIECIPHDEYREPFFGGGSVFFAKEKSKYNILNDLEENIINLYKSIEDEELCDNLCNLVATEIATKVRHEEVKNMNVENDLMKAFKTYYLNRTSYSGIINNPAWGYANGKSSPPQNWPKFLKDASLKLKDVELKSVDFSEIISQEAKGNSVLMYLDPPYYNADQRRAYTKPFQEYDHIRLMEQLKTTPYKFCLSYDDCPEIRSLYSWANIYNVSWLYNTNNCSGESRKKGNELIITNYKVEI